MSSVTTEFYEKIDELNQETDTLLEEIDKMRSMMGLLNEYAYQAVTKGIEEFFEYIFGRGTFDHVALGEKIKRFEINPAVGDKIAAMKPRIVIGAITGATRIFAGIVAREN